MAGAVPSSVARTSRPARAADRSTALGYVVSFDALPVDGEAVGYAFMRVSDGTGYRVAIHVTPTGTVYAAVDALNGDAVEALDGRVQVAAASGSGAPSLSVRVEATGSDPTTIRARVWPVGQAEPAGWQLSVVDWSGALQGAGAVGLGWLLDATADRGVTVRHAGLTADAIEETER
jgi:hypothetical protein